jgi:hypothetical protein
LDYHNPKAVSSVQKLTFTAKIAVAWLFTATACLAGLF